MRIIVFLQCQVLTQYKLFTLFIQAFVLCANALAGFEQSLQTTPVFSKAYAGLASSSFDQIVVNPAAGTILSSFRFSLCYSPSPFQLSQLSQFGFLAGQPITLGTVAIGAQSAGFSLYRETQGMLTMSGNVTTDIACGITTRLFHLSILHYGSAATAGIDIGAVFRISELVSVGVSMMNVNGADIGSEDDIPRSIGTGICLRPIPEVMLFADIVKEMRYAETLRFAVEISPIDMVTLSSGIQTEPSRIFGGISVTAAPVTIYYGVGTHADLGLSHSIGLTFNP
jgi:hypothetical protein